MSAPLVVADRIAIAYPRRRAAFWKPQPAPFVAVEDVSFTLAPGETLGLVGESGSGKSTIGRALLGRVPLAAGRIDFRGEDIGKLSGRQMRAMRRHIQPVFQDPYSSLNPRMRVGEIIAEPLHIHDIAHGEAARARVAELLTLVGLSPDYMERSPAAFSGGQRQRIGIARALAASPEFIVADEPVSALDVSIRAQIVNLFRDLQDQLGIAYLFIAHDLAVVRHVSHRIAILYAGRIAEMGTPDQIFREPRHPYTRALIAAIPVPDPARRGQRAKHIRGEPTTRGSAGCLFAPRCPLATEICRQQTPPLTPSLSGGQAACWNSA